MTELKASAFSPIKIRFHELTSEGEGGQSHLIYAREARGAMASHLIMSSFSINCLDIQIEKKTLKESSSSISDLPTKYVQEA